MRISDWSSDVCSSDLVPVTVLSRCQRFDLRRITPDMLFAHFSSILQKEGVEAEAPAIWLIASAAEGSVRDRSEEHTSELQSLMRISYAVFCLKKKKHHKIGQ